MSTIIFKAKINERGEWKSMRRVEDILDAMGFSFGGIRNNEPRGIQCGKYGIIDVELWPHMTRSQRQALQGKITGGATGAVTIALYSNAPMDAVRALADSLEGQPFTTIIYRSSNL
ncbi:hypothetical protein IB024_00140 [Brucella sp. 6810]|uniref:hypothetical protein n=1 Tax=Brucella sp. 6810 TaxID=2769351 RepID=UPI00165C2402|nr:hypothetical protein [Brucella sp. 6810]QNQ62214.1 hypothetical protein IB024_00140 [Brucella sp. 6810]